MVGDSFHNIAIQISIVQYHMQKKTETNNKNTLLHPSETAVSQEFTLSLRSVSMGQKLELVILSYSRIFRLSKPTT